MTRSTLNRLASFSATVALATDAAMGAAAPESPASAGIKFISGDDDVSKIKKAMRAFTYFKTPAELVAALNAAAKETSNFLGLAVFAQGITRGESGDYVLTDETKYADSVPTLAYVGANAKGKDGKSTPVIKYVLAFGIPTLEATLEGAPDLARKVLGKEFRHVYFRQFRDAESIAQAQVGFDSAPIGIEAFAASHARTAAEELDTDTFDAIWPALRKHIGVKHPAVAKLLPPKGEVIKAIRSKSYAEGVYPELEGKHLFLGLAAQVVQAAETQDKPLDASAVKLWAAERATTHIEYRKATAADFDAMDAFDPDAATKALGLATE